MVWSSIISGIASLGGSALGFAGQKSSNKQNLAEAQRNRDFEERMSNTGYQRAMADMKKAGLNPILAYKSGPASTPKGSTGTVQSATAGLKLGEAVTSALQVANLRETNRQIGAQTEKTKTENALLQDDLRQRTKRGKGPAAEALRTGEKAAARVKSKIDKFNTRLRPATSAAGSKFGKYLLKQKRLYQRNKKKYGATPYDRFKKRFKNRPKQSRKSLGSSVNRGSYN